MYAEDHDKNVDLTDENDGANTMAVLNTLGGGGGEDVLAEGEPLGLDTDSDKGKISGSSLAVGVVIVLAVVALLGMRLTLGAITGDNNPVDDIAQIETFLQNQATAVKAGVQGTIKAPDQESKRVMDELQIDPTKHQVPAEEVEGNPFDISKIVARDSGNAKTTGGPAKPDARQTAYDKATAAKNKLRVDSISGQMAFINGDLYRVGDKIAGTGFVLQGVEGLKCTLKTTDEYAFEMTIEYR